MRSFDRHGGEAASLRQALLEALTTLFRREASSLSATVCLDKSLTNADFVSLSGVLELYLRASLDDVKELEAIAQSSYLHDNGFVKLVIAKGVDVPSEVRLHVWNTILCPRTSSTSPSVHSHACDFISVVLCGQMREELYTEASVAGANAVKKFSCGSRGEAAQYSMTELSDASLAKTAVLHLSRGHMHGLRFDALHRIDARDQTATLFLQGHRRQNGTFVYSEPDASWPQIVASNPLSVAEVTATIESVLASCISSS